MNRRFILTVDVVTESNTCVKQSRMPQLEMLFNVIAIFHVPLWFIYNNNLDWRNALKWRDRWSINIPPRGKKAWHFHGLPRSSHKKILRKHRFFLCILVMVMDNHQVNENAKGSYKHHQLIINKHQLTWKPQLFPVVNLRIVSARLSSIPDGDDCRRCSTEFLGRAMAVLTCWGPCQVIWVSVEEVIPATKVNMPAVWEIFLLSLSRHQGIFGQHTWSPN